jgi:hypothetical protein
VEILGWTVSGYIGIASSTTAPTSAGNTALAAKAFFILTQKMDRGEVDFERSDDDSSEKS